MRNSLSLLRLVWKNKNRSFVHRGKFYFRKWWLESQLHIIYVFDANKWICIKSRSILINVWKFSFVFFPQNCCNAMNEWLKMCIYNTILHCIRTIVANGFFFFFFVHHLVTIYFMYIVLCRILYTAVHTTHNSQNGWTHCPWKNMSDSFIINMLLNTLYAA